MLVIAAFAAASLPAPAQAKATVRIVQAQRVDAGSWRTSATRREVVVFEGGRRVKLRLIELE